MYCLSESAAFRLIFVFVFCCVTQQSQSDISTDRPDSKEAGKGKKCSITLLSAFK